jgi:hypothetical protein
VKGPVAHEANRVARAPRKLVQQTASVEQPDAPPADPLPDVAEPEKTAAARALPRPASKARGSSLSDEVKELDRARAALDSGDASKALEELDEHDKQFGTALLGEEAMVIRIQARERAGDKPGAAALANQFLAIYPHSPHASHVRSLLATSVNGTP